MATRHITPSTAHTICDVCGRTLLRGERAEAYVQGGDRRWVCELCKTRALHEGWVREGTVPSYSQNAGGTERRRSLLGRLRSRRPISSSSEADEHELDQNGELEDSRPRPARERGPAIRPPADRQPAEPVAEGPEPGREPRHVRAIPTSAEQKTVSAIEMFNSSEYPRTVAGVARSLGLPAVSVNPSAVKPSLVNVVVSWELCWYRYEVDLSEGVPSVRVAGQGYELDELTTSERQANAVAYENGELAFAG